MKDNSFVKTGFVKPSPSTLINPLSRPLLIFWVVWKEGIVCQTKPSSALTPTILAGGGGGLRSPVSGVSFIAVRLHVLQAASYRSFTVEVEVVENEMILLLFRIQESQVSELHVLIEDAFPHGVSNAFPRSLLCVNNF